MEYSISSLDKFQTYVLRAVLCILVGLVKEFLWLLNLSLKVEEACPM